MILDHGQTTTHWLWHFQLPPSLSSRAKVPPSNWAPLIFPPPNAPSSAGWDDKTCCKYISDLITTLLFPHLGVFLCSLKKLPKDYIDLVCTFVAIEGCLRDDMAEVEVEVVTCQGP